MTNFSGLSIAGQVVTPDDADWDQARSAWNLAADQHPQPLSAQSALHLGRQPPIDEAAAAQAHRARRAVRHGPSGQLRGDDRQRQVEGRGQPGHRLPAQPSLQQVGQGRRGVVHPQAVHPHDTVGEGHRVLVARRRFEQDGRLTLVAGRVGEPEQGGDRVEEPSGAGRPWQLTSWAIMARTAATSAASSRSVKARVSHGYGRGDPSGSPPSRCPRAVRDGWRTAASPPGRGAVANLPARR